MPESKEGDDIQLERATCSYENCSQRFTLKNTRRFHRQYSQIYNLRLKIMRKKLAVAARRAWGADIPIKKLSDISRGTSECIIIGTVFRKMEMQPTILKEVCAEEGVLPLPPPNKYTMDTDELSLEDEQQRIMLRGNINLAYSVTGTVAAVLGSELEGGILDVREFCYAGLPYQTSPTLDQALLDGGDRYIVLVSDLGLGSRGHDMLSLQMLIDLMTGRLGGTQDEELFSNVVRFVIAGNSLSEETSGRGDEKIAKYLLRNVQAKSVQGVVALDQLMAQLGSCMPVDIMPGEFDPVSQFLPQQPLHKCMLPQSLAYSTVQPVTNPYEACVAGVRLLGTSGENVNNIMKYSGYESRMDIIQLTMECGHISPTCPDTLSCYPYDKKEPFILEECPHVYFVGNQPGFATRTIEGSSGQQVLMIAVPSFNQTSTALFLNLRDLSCRPITIDTQLHVTDMEQ